MKRTQIYLEEEIYERLKVESRIRNVTISELIRERLREKSAVDVNQAKAALKKAAGLWKDRKFDVDEFVRESRRDRER